MSSSVLLVEDDPDILELLTIHLADEGYELTQVSDGDSGYQQTQDKRFDLIILDLMLPGMDGVELCKKVRANDDTTPVLMLTAKSEEIDRVVGLECGADDYMTKPFSIRELKARVKAILRRMQTMSGPAESNGNAIVKSGDLVIDSHKRKVTLHDQRLELTPKEYELLWLLASNPGRSYSRDEILSKVWGYEFHGYEHTVNSHINRLRAKIEPDISKPSYILTSWGIGYRFTEE